MLSGCIIEEDIDYSGNDIKPDGYRKIMESQQACADFCKTIMGGKFWSWSSRDKLCYVKSSSSGRVVLGLCLAIENVDQVQIFSEICAHTDVRICLRDNIPCLFDQPLQSTQSLFDGKILHCTMGIVSFKDFNNCKK